MNSLLTKREEPERSEDPIYELQGRVPGPRGLKQAEMNGCQCTKSKCLKLYCACFAKGKYCAGDCKCQNCHNLKSNKVSAFFVEKKFCLIFFGALKAFGSFGFSLRFICEIFIELIFLKKFGKKLIFLDFGVFFGFLSFFSC